MAIHTDPRTREPRSPSSMIDNASVFWTIVAAALAAALLIWLFSATTVRTPVPSDTNAGPPAEMQPVAPRNLPAPAPTPKPAP